MERAEDLEAELGIEGGSAAFAAQGLAINGCMQDVPFRFGERSW